MGSIGESLNSLAMIFLMIVPGIICAKAKVLTPEQTGGINSLVANVTWPCLVVDAMQIDFSVTMLKQCGYSMIIMIIVFAAALGLAVLLGRCMSMKKQQSYIMTFMLIFANTGFMGIPVINALYGKEAVFYASIVEMVNDIFMFTVGIMLIQIAAGTAKKMELRSLLSPGMFGVIIGFLLFLFDIRLPGFLGRSVNLIGAATTPLSMIVIGLQVGQQSIRQLVGDIRMYVMSFMKLIVIPLIVFVIMIFILHDTSMLAKVLILEFAMPVAACTVIFSAQYKADVAFATRGVLLSTVLSIITIPLFTILLSIAA
ncbi:MAG: AEC family transporter [Eubacteriales bacterium]|jgi:predicted permease|nr:AEC family transporter [Eubacteriales bacterium]